MILLFGMPDAMEWILILVVSVIFLALSFLWIYSLIHCVRSKFADSNTQLIWILIIIMVPVVGPVLYLIVGRDQRIR